ncbi:ribonuclease H-like domain-containing protein [Pelagophyceae sp. CCMP2097]|nr:ribonuclease H-like domain-containing protein [Pelagophyceae sp. CCMP2097]
MWLVLLLLLDPAASLSQQPRGGQQPRRGPPGASRRGPPAAPGKPVGPVVAANSAVTMYSPSAAPVAVEVTYATAPACVEAWLAEHVEARLSAHGSAVLGFDTETRPSFRKGQVFSPATLQLSTDTHCLVLHLQHCVAVPQALADALADPNILLVGVAVDDDAIEMWLHHGLAVNGRIDLGQGCAVSLSAAQSLRGLSEEILGVSLDKSSSLTLTNWAKPALTLRELEYCALDAWAGRALYDAIAAAGGPPVVAVEKPCAELYAARRVRGMLRREFAALDAEFATLGLPRSIIFAAEDRDDEVKAVRRGVERARKKVNNIVKRSAVDAPTSDAAPEK